MPAEGVFWLTRKWSAIWAPLAVVLAVVVSLVVGLAAGAVPKSWGWAHDWWLLLSIAAGLLVASALVAVLQARPPGNGEKKRSPVVHIENPRSPSYAAPDTSVASTAVSPIVTEQSPDYKDQQSPRSPGSPQFSDLVYALGRALSNQVTIYQICERAGMNRGDLEDGFVNAPARWHTALSLAVESGLEEELCREAVRASPNRALHAAVAAYIN
jgi:hypothetical protein